MQSFDAIREQLLQTQATLRGRVSAIRRDRRQVDGPLAADWQEQATEMENDEVLTFLDSEGRQELERVATALARIDAGTYGKCTGCRKKIPIKRLAALPHATTCVKCAA